MNGEICFIKGITMAWPVRWSRWAAGLMVLTACVVGPTQGWAEQVKWVDWTSAGGGVATGSAAGVTVTYTGQLSPSAQTNGGTNYWAASSSTYTSPPVVDNPPPDSDIIRLTGGAALPANTLTFSQPVHNPVMAILSMGQGGVAVTYEFDAPFDVLNFGPGHWGNGPLTELPGDVLEGREGHGIIQFQGTFSSISWTVPTAENWHGFTLAVPEPSVMGLLSVGLAAVGSSRRRR